MIKKIGQLPSIDWNKLVWSIFLDSKCEWKWLKIHKQLVILKKSSAQNYNIYVRFHEIFMHANYQVSISIDSNVMDIWPLTLKDDLDMSYSKCAALKIYMHAKYQVS